MMVPDGFLKSGIELGLHPPAYGIDDLVFQWGRRRDLRERRASADDQHRGCMLARRLAENLEELSGINRIEHGIPTSADRRRSACQTCLMISTSPILSKRSFQEITFDSSYS